MNSAKTEKTTEEEDEEEEEEEGRRKDREDSAEINHKTIHRGSENMAASATNCIILNAGRSQN